MSTIQGGMMVNVSGGHSSFHGSGYMDDVQSASGRGGANNLSYSKGWRRSYSGVEFRLSSTSMMSAYSMSGVAEYEKVAALEDFARGDR